MQPEEAREWWKKAQTDLTSAFVLIEHNPPIIETTCFHCQQAAEKAIKAYLIWQGIPFQKIHNLSYLIDLCSIHDKRFEELHSDAETLTPYAINIRYPGENWASAEDAKAALRAAEKIIGCIATWIPIEQ